MKRKLRIPKKMTTVTHRNVASLMGKIDKFLSKPTRRYKGDFCLPSHKEIVELDGRNFEFQKYTEEEFPVFEPFLGRCTWHQFRKEFMETGESTHLRKEALDPLYLAIESNFTTYCQSIYVGDKIKITGDRLIIIRHYDKNVADTLKMRYEEYIHSDYTSDELLEIKRSYLYDVIAEQSYYADDYLEMYIEDWFARRPIKDVIDNILKYIHEDTINCLNMPIPGKIICSIPYYDDEESETEKVDFFIDIPDFLKNGSTKDNWYFTNYDKEAPDDRTQDVKDVALVVKREYINSYNQKSEQPDYDYDEIDYSEW